MDIDNINSRMNNYDNSIQKTLENVNFHKMQPNQVDINPVVIFRDIFQDCKYPTEMSIPIKMGLPESFVNEIKELFDFKSIWKSFELDYEVKKMPRMASELLVNDTFMIKILFADAFSNSTNSTYQNFIEKQRRNNPSSILKAKKRSGEIIELVGYISSVTIYFNPNIDLNAHKKFLIWLESYYQNEDVHTGYDLGRSSISMLVKEGNDTYFRDFSVKNDSNLDNAEIVYGEGFLDFNSELLDRLEKEKKGLVLFHGAPGTGKTYYIRNLLKDLASKNKRVIYIPPSLVEYMMEPSMLNFIINDITENEEDTILLIEDAEPLLESRKHGQGRTTGITNLLNSTDGILNDILGLIVIATFNTDIHNIDEALLRPGRLLARKEFKNIPAKNLEKAAELFAVDSSKIEKNKDYSIAELTSLSTDKQIINHEIEEERKIGFSR